MAGPAPAPAGPPPSAPSPVSPYSDLPADLPHHYQLLDVADRQLKQAIATGGFYKEAEVLAALRHIEADLAKIISAYARGSKGGPMEAPAVQTGVEDDEGDTGPAVPIGDDDDTGDLE